MFHHRTQREERMTNIEIRNYNLEPTEENVLQSLKNDTCGRNDSLKCFLETIDKSASLPVFAINAEWGEGKTFFVLQAKMILEHLNPNCKQDAEINGELEQLLNLPNTAMEKPNMTRTIFPIYYNAWLYDDHKDPLVSFLYFLSITFQKKYSKLDESGLKKLSEALNIITSWRLGFNSDLENISKAFSGTDVAKGIAYLEDAKLLVDEAFSDLLEGNDGLVIFVDEIDRCNPKYAVDFLEIIKHFFSCTKVQFVFSTNIKQLSETICTVYGAGFDGTRYLNKFFDVTTELPPVPMDKLMGKYNTLKSYYYVEGFARSLISSMHFTMREMNDYLGSVTLISAKCQMAISNSWNYASEEFAFICYPVLLFALSLTNRKKYDDFKNGKGEALLLELLFQWEEWEHCARKTLLPRAKALEADAATLVDAVKAHYRRIFSSVSVKDRDTIALKETILQLASVIG